MKTMLRATPLLLSFAFPAHALVDSVSMARAFPEGGLKGIDATNVQVGQARELVAKALGDDVRDLVFVPVTPCTVWDTRFATEPQSAGAVANATTKRFYSHDGAGGNYTTWGGNPSCPETLQASIGGRPYAVLMTVYISDATANGWLTLYRDGDLDPSQATISVYYSPGPTRTQTVISKSSRGYGSGTFDVAATSRFGSVNASASVTGYFLKPVNITLPNSTATSGNILKGADRFIHNTGSDNTFVGVNSGSFSQTGTGNVAVGVSALTASATGLHNTAVGTNALAAYVGDQSTAVGAFALERDPGSGGSTAVGYFALGNNTGGENTAVGRLALYANTTGGANTALGNVALSRVTTGSQNIAVGYFAGYGITAGNDTIMIGNVGVAGDSATIRMGTFQTRAFVAGIRGVTTTNSNAIPVLIDSAGQLGTASSSARVKDDIADMASASARLMRLRPVTFHYKAHKAMGDASPQFGLVAEEVAQQMPELVARNADGNAETVYYQFLPPMLLNEYQKQQRTIDELRAEMAALRREVALMKKGARQ